MITMTCKFKPNCYQRNIYCGKLEAGTFTRPTGLQIFQPVKSCGASRQVPSIVCVLVLIRTALSV